MWISFTVLGPVHYLTQMSWLYDRSFFFREPAAKRIFLPAAAGAAALYVYAALDPATLRLSACAMLTVFLLPAFLGTPKKYTVGVGFAAATGLLLCTSPAVALFCAVFLPTVIHVGLFTLLFVLTGALRSGSAASYISAACWLACAFALFLFPPPEHVIAAAWAKPPRAFWDGLAGALGFLAGKPLSAIYPFLTFAYTYHFLNWFSKTELLKWHQIPVKRHMAIGAGFIAAIAACLYDYRFGYMAVLLPLSIMHVVLEFPLDVQVITGLPAAARAARAKARGGPAR